MQAVLHHAVWRNDVKRVGQCLEENATLVQEREKESGWMPLHVALYYGHLRVAARLLAREARLDARDLDDRTPLELVSKELPATGEFKTDVFSWGCGANYQLGTGNSGWQSLPRRLETLTDGRVVEIAASKFHSVAVTQEGKVYTWGWGLGGRLGHPDPKLHSANGAQIFPRLVTELSAKRVISVAAAKHHSLAVTQNGEVYSWGLHRDGRLGYAAGGSKQVTPRRIGALKGVHAIQAAAANRHSAILSETGAVYTWGSNVHGQLGYGTVDSGSNPTPSCVEALKHKSVSQLSLAKKHSLALTKDGDVYSWGHKGVAPKRIRVHGSRDRESLNSQGAPIHFHRGSQKVKKPIAVLIAAGAYESCCLTTTGVVLGWRSAELQGSVMEVGGKLSGKKAISISASKTATCVVTNDGRVYCWEVSPSGGSSVSGLMPGMKNAASVAMGESHRLILQKWTPAPVTSSPDVSECGSESAMTYASNHISVASDLELETDSNAFKCLMSSKGKKETKVTETKVTEGLQSLQLMCEKTVVQHVLDPRTALQFFCYADTIQAGFLRSRCLHLIVHNLALVLHEAHECFAKMPEELLMEIEQVYQERMLLRKPVKGGKGSLKTESFEHETGIATRRPTLPSQSAPDPSSPAAESAKSSALKESRTPVAQAQENRFLPNRRSLVKIEQFLRNKLKQIETLLQREVAGAVLDEGQRAKIARWGMYQRALDALERGASNEEVEQILTEPQSTVASEQVKNRERMKKKPVQLPKIPPNSQPSPNLLPVHRTKSREIGQLPRFLEPSRMKKTPPVKADHPPAVPHTEPSRKEKKWLALDLQSEPKKQGAIMCKAQPSKEVKMSLSDFMAAPVEPPPPAKSTGPAWGGVHVHSSSSFQSIQEEQRNYRPGMKSATGMRPVVERRRTVSRWQLHADVQVQSIHCIQTEEKAVQQLAALYKGATVRVKPGTARDTGNKPAAKR